MSMNLNILRTEWIYVIIYNSKIYLIITDCRTSWKIQLILAMLKYAFAFIVFMQFCLAF